MAGKYKGVQAIFLRENSLAHYIPCCAHSLNLVGVHAASVNSVVVSFLELFSRCIISSHLLQVGGIKLHLLVGSALKWLQTRGGVRNLM